jgi:PIN domain nuclease of toxin-antitoxin system
MGNSDMILLDTCALLWWTVEPDVLSPMAFQKTKTFRREGCAISSITVWEIGIKIKKGKLDIHVTLDEYVKRICRIDYLTIIPVDEHVWLRNILLEWENRDPADRTIVATALLHDLPIMTKDGMIDSYYPNIIW